MLNERIESYIYDEILRNIEDCLDMVVELEEYEKNKREIWDFIEADIISKINFRKDKK